MATALRTVDPPRMTAKPLLNQSRSTGVCCAAFHAEIAESAYGLFAKHGSRNGHDAETHVKAKHAAEKHAHHHSSAAASASSS